MKRRDLEKHLKKHGCYPHREGKEHQVWVNPETGQKAPMSRQRELKTAMGKAICKQLGVPVIDKT
ncbi:MAG: type II toxin-antitoxin system HicA family toxin [Planctomycetota bacterium]